MEKDIVYVKIRKDLMKKEEKEGLKKVEGIGMLMNKDVKGFERWLGKRKKVKKELRENIMEDMEKDGEI